jgi:hypothetical protein
MFFGDFFGRSENDSLPRQLKKLGFAVRSFCNGDIFMRYPMNDSNYEHENFTRLSREEMILDLGTTPQFDWRADRYWETFNAYYGSADDVDRQMPEKWRDYLQTEVNDNSFIFLHFWMAHHPYGMGSLVGQNYGAIGKDLISRLERGEMSCGFVKNIYLQRVYDIINIHLRNLISVLKEKIFIIIHL